MQGLKCVVTDFLILVFEKGYASSTPTGYGKTAFLEVFRPKFNFKSEIKNSVQRIEVLQGGEQLFGAHTHFQREYTDQM